MIAQGWAVRKEWENTFEFLEKYTELATGDIYPLRFTEILFFINWTAGWKSRCLGRSASQKCLLNSAQYDAGSYRQSGFSGDFRRIPIWETGIPAKKE